MDINFDVQHLYLSISEKEQFREIISFEEWPFFKKKLRLICSEWPGSTKIRTVEFDPKEFKSVEGEILKERCGTDGVNILLSPNLL